MSVLPINWHHLRLVEGGRGGEKIPNNLINQLIPTDCDTALEFLLATTILVR